jgi:ABC-type lipoprotein release transport system permease subunit
VNVVIAWLRLEVRRRWRSLAVLALLIAVAGGTVMTALAGSRRGASAIERLSAHALPATAMVLPNTPGFDWNKVQKLPEVEALTKFIVNGPLNIEGVSGDGVSFPPTDDAMTRTIEKPVIFRGRVLDPTRDDEVLVSPKFVRTYHKDIGDTLVLDLPSPAQVMNADEDVTRFDGPHITVRIVGVGRTPWGFQTDGPGEPGGLLMSPGVVALHPANTLGPNDPNNPIYVNALVRLRGGEAAISQFRRDLAGVTGRSDIEVTNLPDSYRTAQRQMAFEARCLFAFGCAAFVAALVLIGQAIARYAAASTAELQTLRAVGMTPRQAIGTAAAAPTIAGVIGAAVGSIAGFVASHWFPIGTASAAEPAPGMTADWVVFGPSLALICALVAVGAGAAGWVALGAARRAKPARRSGVASAAARAGVAVPAVIGARFALEPGRRRTAVPTRPAIIGAVVGVLGVVAAFTLSHGVSDAASHPERFGQTYQVSAFLGINGMDFAPPGKVVAALQADSGVTGIDDGRTAVATGRGGNGSVSLYAYSSGPKEMPVVVTSGRMPTSPHEVALAPRSLTELHTHVGAQVDLEGRKKGVTRQSFLVTGTALVPSGPHNAYSEGGWVTSSGFDSLFDGFKFHFVFVTLRPDAQGEAAAAKLTAAVVARDPELKGLELGPPDPLSEIAALRQVRAIPVALAVFLALLAVGAVGHALATAVRRRSHELAVLRALGMTQSQCRWVVVTQASILAIIGLLFGVPLGLALGRTVWRAVANYTPLQYVPPTAALALLLVVPAALLIANALAAVPGRRAARLRISHILRAE